jgi:Bacterial low temperature requirement A protein (LtrA)
LIAIAGAFELVTGVIVAAALGIVAVSALWWLYLDVAAIFARRRLMQARGIEQARLARDSYRYLHLPMVAGIVLFAFGLETTLHDVGDALDTVPAVALCGGAALYLLGHIAFLFRTTRHVFRRGRSGRLRCSSSSRLRSRSGRSRPSPSSASCAPWSSRTRRSAIALTGSRSGTPGRRRTWRTSPLPRAPLGMLRGLLPTSWSKLWRAKVRRRS